MTLSHGTRLGPYEISAPLGAGGMGEVYKAKDTRLDRSVAIKVLPAQVSADPERRPGGRGVGAQDRVSQAAVFVNGPLQLSCLGGRRETVLQGHRPVSGAGGGARLRQPSSRSDGSRFPRRRVC